MLMWFPIAALFLAARWLTARALKVRLWLFPREGTLRARILIALAGPLACLLALELFAFTVGLIAGVQRPAAPAVLSVQPDSPSARAGLMPGDRIVAIEGHAMQTVPDVLAQVQASAGQPFALEIERAGTRHHMTAQAQLDGTKYRIGVQLDGSVRYERGGPLLALQGAVQLPLHLSRVLLRSVRQTIQGQPAIEAVGPVGVVRIAQQSPSPAHLALNVIGFWLLVIAAFGFVVSVVLLLVVRPRGR